MRYNWSLHACRHILVFIVLMYYIYNNPTSTHYQWSLVSSPMSGSRSSVKVLLAIRVLNPGGSGLGHSMIVIVGGVDLSLCTTDKIMRSTSRHWFMTWTSWLHSIQDSAYYISNYESTQQPTGMYPHPTHLPSLQRTTATYLSHRGNMFHVDMLKLAA